MVEGHLDLGHDVCKTNKLCESEEVVAGFMVGYQWLNLLREKLPELRQHAGADNSHYSHSETSMDVSVTDPQFF